jgi:hypothetical protein
LSDHLILSDYEASDFVCRIPFHDDLCFRNPEIFYWAREVEKDVFSGPVPIVLENRILIPMIYKGSRYFALEPGGY